MGAVNWTRSEEANIGLLETKLRREVAKEIFFAAFAGETIVKYDDRGRKRKIPSGKPIEVMNDFLEDGMDHMKIPMLLELQGTGIYGDNQLETNEEEQDIYYVNTYVNQLRNAIRTAGRMSELRVRILNIMKERQPQLIRWLARKREVNIVKAFLEGYSDHVMATTANGGLYINSGQKVCHPNFWCAGATAFSTWNATDATYEGTLDDDLTNVTDTSTDYMSTSLIEEMAVAVQTKNIKPMVMENGYSFIPWVMHPKQIKQLRGDTDWKSANQRAFVGQMAKENPVFTRAAGEYAGFVIFERELSVFGASPAGTSSSVTFGATNPLAAVDTYPRKCSIIFGGGAIATGQAEKAYLDVDNFDYANQTGIAVGSIVGDARADFVDNTTTKTAVINQSSIVVATYSA